MNGLAGRAAPQDEAASIDAQIDMATQVVREAIYGDENGERLIAMVDNATSVGAGMGKAILLAAQQLVTGLHEKHPDLDPTIWLMSGGVLDNLLEDLADILLSGGVEVDQEDIEEARAIVEDDLSAMVEQGGANEPVR